MMTNESWHVRMLLPPCNRIIQRDDDLVTDPFTSNIESNILKSFLGLLRHNFMKTSMMAICPPSARQVTRP